MQGIVSQKYSEALNFKINVGHLDCPKPSSFLSIKYTVIIKGEKKVAFGFVVL